MANSNIDEIGIITEESDSSYSKTANHGVEKVCKDLVECKSYYKMSAVSLLHNVQFVDHPFSASKFFIDKKCVTDIESDISAKVR